MQDLLSAADVVEELEGLLGDRLEAVYRFGAEFARRRRLRLLVLVDRLDRGLLDSLSSLAERCGEGGVHLRLDTVDDVLRGADTFPVFCLEFLATRELLHGEDLLVGLRVELSSLRLRVEQGLRVVRRDLVQAYLGRGSDEGLTLTLRQATHRLLYLFEGLLRVRSEEPAGKRTADETFEAVGALLEESDRRTLGRLYEFGSFKGRPDRAEVLALYAGALATLRALIDTIDSMAVSD